MDINILIKIRSLFRRRENFHCLSYCWDNRQIIVHQTEQQYLAQISNLKNNGLVKRAQCYLDQPLLLNNSTYLIYMISFGDFRKGKIVRGQNPIAKGLGICLFDYVYIFVEQINQAKQKMIARINQMQQKGQNFHKNLMLEIYKKIYIELSQNFSSYDLKNLQKQQEKTQSILT